MKRAEKKPSIHTEAVHALVTFLTRPHTCQHPLIVERYEIRQIPSGPQKGREVLQIHAAPRFRIPSWICEPVDPYREEIVKNRPNNYIVRPATPQKQTYDLISIYADLAELALSILRDRKQDSIGERWCSWLSLQRHLESKWPERIWIWNSDNCNDFRALGPTAELSAFMGACDADIEQSAVLLISHSQAKLGIAAVNRQFQDCPIIYD
jgi:hypothetical protein